MTGGFFNYIVYPYLIASNAVVGYVSKAARESCYDSLTDENASWWNSWWKDAEKTAICERVGTEVFNYYEPFVSSLFKVGYYAMGMGFAGNKIFNLLRDIEYYKYRNKSDEEIQNLNSTQVESFKIGTRASQSTWAQAKGLFSYHTWKAPKAYWAGLAAKNHSDNALIEKIKAKNP